MLPGFIDIGRDHTVYHAGFSECHVGGIGIIEALGIGVITLDLPLHREIRIEHHRIFERILFLPGQAIREQQPVSVCTLYDRRPVLGKLCLRHFIREGDLLCQMQVIIVDLHDPCLPVIDIGTVLVALFDIVQRRDPAVRKLCDTGGLCFLPLVDFQVLPGILVTQIQLVVPRPFEAQVDHTPVRDAQRGIPDALVFQLFGCIRLREIDLHCRARPPPAASGQKQQRRSAEGCYHLFLHMATSLQKGDFYALHRKYTSAPRILTLLRNFPWILYACTNQTPRFCADRRDLTEAPCICYTKDTTCNRTGSKRRNYRCVDGFSQALP